MLDPAAAGIRPRAVASRPWSGRAAFRSRAGSTAVAAWAVGGRAGTAAASAARAGAGVHSGREGGRDRQPLRLQTGLEHIQGGGDCGCHRAGQRAGQEELRPGEGVVLACLVARAAGLAHRLLDRLVGGHEHAGVWPVHQKRGRVRAEESAHALLLDDGANAVGHAVVEAKLEALLHHVKRGQNGVMQRRGHCAAGGGGQRAVAWLVDPERNLCALVDGKVGGVRRDTAYHHHRGAAPQPHQTVLRHEPPKPQPPLPGRAASLQVRLVRVHREHPNVLHDPRA
mmetsp:Transcript_12064/g.46904  ORF Transcript_12064/g.46904 Transcript_12064/m.46904 type:complete len:283 (+) Transcript_12064:931-1779(+)